MSNAVFEFADYSHQVEAVRRRLVDALKACEGKDITALALDVPDLDCSETSSARRAALLSIAFVGQYNAGKSTIVRALTGDSSIKINADVCTDKVTAYDWKGIRLIDTPGIHAGYPDHDTATYRAIDRADLLVFVITNELFDDVIGPHFRDLVFEREKSREILLVVNKMDQDPGTPDIKRPDLERVTRPLTVVDFRTVFIDARTYLDAQRDTNAQDQQQLVEISNFRSFITTLNNFVQENGLMGRLTTPLSIMRSIAQQADAFLSVDLPEERAALELLSRKRRLLVSSKARLNGTLRGVISQAAADIVGYGDVVVEMIEPGIAEDILQARHEEAQRLMRERCSQLETETASEIEGELKDLDCQLDALHNEHFAEQLRNLVRDTIGTCHFSGNTPSAAEWTARTETESSERNARLRKVGDVLDGLGKHSSKWTTGPFAQSARVGSATASRGSQAHQVIYNVGKFLGKNFKPWEAVNTARVIGNFGKVIGAVGGVLALCAQVADDKQQEQHCLAVKEKRASLRRAYRESVREIEREFWESFDKFDQEFYVNELESVDSVFCDLKEQQEGRTSAASLFRSIESEIRGLINKIQAEATHL
jgi:small GTP-binding protein